MHFVGQNNNDLSLLGPVIFIRWKIKCKLNPGVIVVEKPLKVVEGG